MSLIDRISCLSIHSAAPCLLEKLVFKVIARHALICDFVHCFLAVFLVQVSGLPYAGLDLSPTHAS